MHQVQGMLDGIILQPTSMILVAPSVDQPNLAY